MNYLKEKCLICQKEFSEKDDIVVCPICGTPHHRTCYEAEGHCKNEALHSEGFEWTPSEDFRENEPVRTENDGYQIVFCPECGKENSASEPVCLNCGARLYNNSQGSFNQQPIMLPNMQNQPFSTPVIEISPDDTIGGNKVSDTAEYIQMAANRYIPKFFRMEKTGKKISFNWASFIFSPYWFFFRKMHVIGFVIMLVSLLITGACTTDRMVKASNDYYQAIQQYMNEEISAQEVEALSAEIVKLPEVAIMSFSGLAIKLFCGFFGNYFYKKKVINDIKDIKEKTASPEEYRITLFKRGGISGLMCGLSILGYYCAEQILTMLLAK